MPEIAKKLLKCRFYGKNRRIFTYFDRLIALFTLKQILTLSRTRYSPSSHPISAKVKFKKHLSCPKYLSKRAKQQKNTFRVLKVVFSFQFALAQRSLPPPLMLIACRDILLRMFTHLATATFLRPRSLRHKNFLAAAIFLTKVDTCSKSA